MRKIKREQLQSRGVDVVFVARNLNNSRMKSVAGMIASHVKLVVENVRKTEQDMKWFV